MDTNRRMWLLLGAFALLFGVIACTLDEKPDGAQYWWQARGPVVPHDSFPTDCTLCHQGETWREIRTDFVYDHAKETGYALEGAHAAAECLRCHNDRGPAEMFAGRGCRGCHEDVHKGTLGNDCSSCHDQESFKAKDQIAKHNLTRFPLVGAHAATECFRCHPGAQVGQFQPADTECVACHTADLARATNPDHATNGWTQDCDRCHIPTDWGGAAFNHSWWPLNGAHAAANCTDCHGGGVFVGTPNDCYDCHQTDYANSTSPDHAALGISTNCKQCHNTSTWDGAHFNHFGIVDGCVNCHLADFQGTTNPDHVAMGLSTSCEQCHGTSTWLSGEFDHAGISNGCVNCHQADYNGTTNPNHAATGYGTDCESCHGTNGWTNVTFGHLGITNGCLTCHQTDYTSTTSPNHAGTGIGTNCEQCHDTLDWNNAVFDHTGITNGCVTCHQTDYNNTTSPNHAALGLGTTCQTCHDTVDWNNGTFDHTGVTNGCMSCHMPEYNATTNPKHSTAGFGTDCQTCHDTVDWNNGQFNHTQFPITSGKHKNFDCIECHLAPPNYIQFSCTHCHEHKKSSMDNEHQGVNNYTWTSNGCYACHPDGKE
ncbi:MAG: hypothetical protein IT453_04325 [Planctomycetes bacterium]|nr:hypothetical protein [Planctomycetota bacterium]